MKINLPFEDEIPDRYTQYGRNISPKIELEDVPEDAVTIVIFIENKSAPENLSIHWAIWNIPAERNIVPEAIARAERPEAIDGAVQGNNDYHIIGYQGPKMFPGEERYEFTAYALDIKLNLSPGSRKEQVMEAMKGHVADKATVERGYTS
jgi:Raf kinase inhibitor-like YbhB/YbcL family protein